MYTSLYCPYQRQNKLLIGPVSFGLGTGKQSTNWITVLYMKSTIPRVVQGQYRDAAKEWAVEDLLGLSWLLLCFQIFLYTPPYA